MFIAREPRVKEPRVNRRIRVQEVLLIDDQGVQVGVVPVSDALRRAEEEALDLVEVAPNASPPVCRIMDYGRFKYEQKKKAHDSRKKHHTVHLKEVKLRPRTEEHDRAYKLAHIKRFLRGGDKVKVTIVFRGREMAYPDRGRKVLDHVLQDIGDLATVEQLPRMEGRLMVAILAPTHHD